MKIKILRIIRERMGTVTLQELCQECGVSKETVIRLIRQLVSDGYDIELEPGKGYRLNSYPESISSCELMSRINTQWAGKRVYYREETESTNDDAKFLAEEGMEHGSLVIAETQTAGKGRRGRSWCSPKGSSIYMSMLLRPDLPVDRASMLTLVMAVSVADALSQLYDLEVKIKWPNDILINKKKVCGILTELYDHPDHTYSVVVGTGINVNQKGFPEEIAEIATSVLIEKGDSCNRADIVLAVMEYFEYYYDLFAEGGDLSALVDIYDAYLINRNEQVKILDPAGEYEGLAKGINDRGELIVELADGKITTVYSGEVSVRGIYGYT